MEGENTEIGNIGSNYLLLITKLMSPILVLTNNSRLFKEVLVYPGAFYSSILVEVNVNILSETARVIVANGLSISES